MKVRLEAEHFQLYHQNVKFKLAVDRSWYDTLCHHLCLIVFIWSNHVYKINIEEKTNNTINRVIPRRLMSFQLTVQLTLI